MAAELQPVAPLLSPELRSPLLDARRAGGLGAAGPVIKAAELDGTDPARGGEGIDFAGILTRAIEADAASRRATEAYATGQSQNIHETMVAMQKAGVSFQLLVTVRNKLLEAYRTMMHMS